MTIEPSPQSCLIRAYTALQALDMQGAEQHINAGFQHVLHKWCARRPRRLARSSSGRTQPPPRRAGFCRAPRAAAPAAPRVRDTYSAAPRSGAPLTHAPLSSPPSLLLPSRPRRWQLPEQPWSSAAHCVLLQQMQQLVELKESVRVMYDISTVGGAEGVHSVPPSVCVRSFIYLWT